MTPFMTGAAPTFTGVNVGKMAWAYRGGIDTIQFYQTSYDSLMNMNHIATNYVWWDTFMTTVQANLPNTATLTDTTPGASVSFTGATAQYFEQQVGRTVAAPDFLFTAGAIAPTAQTLANWTVLSGYADHYGDASYDCRSRAQFGRGKRSLPRARPFTTGFPT